MSLEFFKIYNDFLSHSERSDIWKHLNGPIFSGTHTSTGDLGNQRIFFKSDLSEIDTFTNLIPKLKNILPVNNYELVRCWAIAHQTGSHGDLHQDLGGDYSVILYPHDNWHVSWGGETIFFDPNKYEIIKSVLPLPRQAVIFNSNIYHCARPTTSHFLGIRYVVNYLFRIIDK